MWFAVWVCWGLLYLRMLLSTATGIICVTVADVSNPSYFISIAFIASLVKDLYQFGIGCLGTIPCFPGVQSFSPINLGGKDYYYQSITSSSSYETHFCKFNFFGYAAFTFATSLDFNLSLSAMRPSHSVIESAILPRWLSSTSTSSLFKPITIIIASYFPES